MGPWVALAALAGFFVWASAQDGGLSGVFERFGDWVEGRLDDVTGSAEVGEAVEYLNGVYRDTGSYPQLSSEEMREIEEVQLAGLDLRRCSPHHMVVSAFTARGTVSYLLVGGDDWGRVEGKHPCPADVLAPSPWTVPPPEP